LTEISIEHIETEVINDTAYAIAYWTATNDAGETGAEGYSLAIFQRENGEWRIHRHISNLVMPEQGQNGGEGETGGGG
jgi:ketosteroid isomerase-like protein